MLKHHFLGCLLIIAPSVIGLTVIVMNRFRDRDNLQKQLMQSLPQPAIRLDEFICPGCTRYCFHAPECERQLRYDTWKREAVQCEPIRRACALNRH